MSWIPGWDAIASAHWWSNFYFWVSIISLIMLGVFEAFSHRYSERKDELAAIEQQHIQEQHAKDMAALHLQAAVLEKDAATANENAAQANERAENARLEQERLKQIVKWRTIDPINLSVLIRELSKEDGGEIDLLFAPNDPEAQYFAIKILRDAFDAANRISGQPKWNVHFRAWSSGAMFFGIDIPGPENVQVLGLRSAFSIAHIAFSTVDLPSETPAIAVGNGLSWTPPSKHDALILVGSKPPPL